MGTKPRRHIAIDACKQAVREATTTDPLADTRGKADDGDNPERGRGCRRIMANSAEAGSTKQARTKRARTKQALKRSSPEA